MRIEKQQLVEDLKEFVARDKSILLITYTGLTVADFQELRDALREIRAEAHVVPNRLLRKAAEQQEIPELAGYSLAGDTALVTGGEDPVQVAKTVETFAKVHKECSFKLGYIESRLYTPEELSMLTKLPSREILLAQLLGVLQGPSRQLVGVLHAKLASIVYALKAYLDKQEESAS